MPTTQETHLKGNETCPKWDNKSQSLDCKAWNTKHIFSKLSPNLTLGIFQILGHQEFFSCEKNHKVFILQFVKWCRKTHKLSSSNNVFTIQINEFQFVGSLFLVLYFWFHNQKQWSVPFLEETLLPPNLKSFWINQSSCKSLNFLDTTPDITACDHCITTTIVTFFWACPFFF